MKRHFEFFLFWISFFGFLGVLMVVFLNHTMWLDLCISHFFQWLICPIFTDIMIKVTTFGSAVGILAILSILLIVSFRHSTFFFYTKMLTLTLLLTTFVNVVVKELVCRPRPTMWRLVLESGYSFPSGHSMVSMAFYGFCIFMAGSFLTGWKRKIVCVFCGVFIFLIGVSRIYLGVHYFTDVIGGFLLGLSILSIMILFTKKYAVLEQKS